MNFLKSQFTISGPFDPYTLPSPMDIVVFEVEDVGKRGMEIATPCDVVLD
jgi:hypothetical protein